MKKLRISLLAIIALAICLSSVLTMGSRVNVSKVLNSNNYKSYVADGVIWPPPALSTSPLDNIG